MPDQSEQGLPCRMRIPQPEWGQHSRRRTTMPGGSTTLRMSHRPRLRLMVTKDTDRDAER